MLRLPVVLAAALALVLPATLVPTASAHCDPGTQGEVALGLSTCPLNEPIEDVLDALNAASDRTVAFVLAKNFRWHPEVVTVKSGGTVVWVYADVEQNQQHNPVSSGPCSSSAVNPASNPQACAPTSPSRCFNAGVEVGGLDSVGDYYPLTFKYTPASGLLQKSRGILSGTPGLGLLAENFKNCPSGTGYNSPAQTVIPYHCAIHGQTSTPIKEMRGAIVVLA